MCPCEGANDVLELGLECEPPVHDRRRGGGGGERGQDRAGMLSNMLHKFREGKHVNRKVPTRYSIRKRPDQTRQGQYYREVVGGDRGSGEDGRGGAGEGCESAPNIEPVKT